ADGLTPIASAGNVLRPQTSLKLSLRLPPTTDGGQATHALKRLLEADPPHRATVCFDVEQGATGWNAPPTAAWLKQAVNDASLQFYGKPSAAMGEGGTIPFMAMLGKHLPYRSFPCARRLGSVGILFGLRCPMGDSRDPIRPRCRKSTSSTRTPPGSSLCAPLSPSSTCPSRNGF